MTDKHSMANYPKKFKGCVVSPTKICLQFQEVQLKLRKNPNSSEWLKMPNGEQAAAVSTTGTEFDISAMGCQMPTLEDMQFSLINAYVHYGRNNAEVYRETYGKEFLDYLLLVQAELANAILKVKAIEE